MPRDPDQEARECLFDAQRLMRNRQYLPQDSRARARQLELARAEAARAVDLAERWRPACRAFARWLDRQEP